MRAHHERLSFSFEICAYRADELDVTATAREILAVAQARLLSWIGDWLGPLEHRPLAITAIQRHTVAYYRIELTSPPTIPGRILTYLIGLTLAADRTVSDEHAARLGLVSIRGPNPTALAELRALPFLHEGRPWLLEWSDVDPDVLALSHSVHEGRLIAGQLDASTRRRIDEARLTGRGDDPLSALVLRTPEAQDELLERVAAGDPTALAEAVLLRHMTPATLGAMIASSHHHGLETIARIMRTVGVTQLREPGNAEMIARAWRGGATVPRALALTVEVHSVGYTRLVGGRCTRRTWEEVEPMLAEAEAAGGVLRDFAQRLAARRW